MQLLEVRGLRKYFAARRGFFPPVRERIRAVDGVSLTLAGGQTLGLVGESGCGKTTLGRSIVRLLEPTAGDIVFEGENITHLKGKRLRARRRGFQMIFQDPYGALNPWMTVGEIIAEAIDAHGLADSPGARRQRVEYLLGAVGLGGAHVGRYPRELSGGQLGRVQIARALSVEARLIVCDEPVGALDVSVQAQVVNLLQDLQRERGVAYLFISHDIGVVEQVSHHVAVMYLGKIVETGETKVVVRAPRHPYTQALISAVPVVGSSRRVKRIVLPGEPPSAASPPVGCPFHPRCPLAEARCKGEVPELREIAAGHFVSCHLAG